MTGRDRKADCFGLWLSETGKCFLFLLVAVLTWCLTVTGPLTLAAAISNKNVGGFYFSVIRAAVSIVLVMPLFFILALHAGIALVIATCGKCPDYSKGAYGATKWVKKSGAYNPLHVEDKSQ